MDTVENKEYRRKQWYFGTAEDKKREAKHRCREWMDVVKPLIKAGEKPVCVEIGVWEGEHAWLIWNNLNPSKLFLVDPFKNMVSFVGIYSADDEDALNWVKDLFKPYPEVQVVRKPSLEAANEFEDESLDYVYIDGIHDYTNAKADMVAWWPKVKKTGCLCGHDAGYDSVQKALKEFDKPGLIITPNGTEWVIPKEVK